MLIVNIILTAIILLFSLYGILFFTTLLIYNFNLFKDNRMRVMFESPIKMIFGNKSKDPVEHKPDRHIMAIQKEWAYMDKISKSEQSTTTLEEEKQAIIKLIEDLFNTKVIQNWIPGIEHIPEPHILLVKLENQNKLEKKYKDLEGFIQDTLLGHIKNFKHIKHISLIKQHM